MGKRTPRRQQDGQTVVWELPRPLFEELQAQFRAVPHPEPDAEPDTVVTERAMGLRVRRECRIRPSNGLFYCVELFPGREVWRGPFDECPRNCR